MRCSDFCNQTKSMLNPSGFNLNSYGCAGQVYFGTGLPVIFHDQWDASALASLQVLQDLSEWENSSLYVEAHNFTLNDGTQCVSLSATSDATHDADVTRVTLTANQVYIQGMAH